MYILSLLAPTYVSKSPQSHQDPIVLLTDDYSEAQTQSVNGHCWRLLDRWEILLDWGDTIIQSFFTVIVDGVAWHDRCDRRMSQLD